MKAQQKKKEDVAELAKVSGMRRNFSIRSPLNFQKLPDKHPMSTTRNTLNESAL